MKNDTEKLLRRADVEKDPALAASLRKMWDDHSIRQTSRQTDSLNNSEHPVKTNS